MRVRETRYFPVVESKATAGKPYWNGRHDVTGSDLHYLPPYYTLSPFNESRTRLAAVFFPSLRSAGEILYTSVIQLHICTRFHTYLDFEIQCYGRNNHII